MRKLTKPVLVADANAMAALGNYTLTPKFDFEHASNSNRPSYPRPLQIRSTTLQISDDAGFHSPDRYTKSEEGTNTPPGTRALPMHVVVLEQILTYSIHTQLAQDPHLCVASLVKRPQDRCSSRRPSGSIDRIVKDISRCDIKADHAKFLGHIDRLVRTVMCGTHQNVALSKKRQEELKVLLTSLSRPSTDDCSNIQAWIDAISDSNQLPGVSDPGEHESGIAHDPAPRKSHETASRPVAQPNTRMATSTVRVTLEHSPHFSPYRSKRTRSLTVSQALHDIITQPLNDTDKKAGFIYFFWDKENFGKLKIGYTKDLHKRLKDWDRKCKRTHAYHPAIARGEIPEIPHVSRVERLIHLELKDCRQKRFCASCNKTHREWFDVGDALVLKIFQKWQKWIIQKPYALDSGTGKWVLRPEMMNTISQVCEPVSPEVKTQSPRRGRAGRKGKRKS
jgi:hypothetical protein